MLDQTRLDGGQGVRVMAGGAKLRHFAPHDRAENSGLTVEDKQQPGHLRLNSEHADQEVQCAEVGSQSIKNRRIAVEILRPAGNVDQLGHIVTHANQGRRGVIEPKD